MARKYTLGERAIIYSSIAGGATYDEVNQALAKEQQRTGLEPRIVPEASYKMVKNKYLPKLGLGGLWKQISTPQSLGELTKEKK